LLAEVYYLCGGFLTSSGIEASATAITFEVLGFLMRNKNLEIVEIALAVEAPWPLQLLV
jgi:hypothetical protein